MMKKVAGFRATRTSSKLLWDGRIPQIISSQITFAPLATRTMASLSKGNPQDSKIVSVEILNSSEAKWVQLQRIIYTDPNNKERTWEMASRKTRQETSTVDAVAILAILAGKTGGKELVLQKQFRPPCSGVCIEMPAGLVDPNESVEVAALRELKEETGYIGKILTVSPPILNDPGFTNTNLSVVTVSVDMTDPANIDPQSQLEEGEFIENFTLPLNGLLEELKKLDGAGFQVDARLYNFALGLQHAAYV